jgi:hypothetical protein
LQTNASADPAASMLVPKIDRADVDWISTLGPGASPDHAPPGRSKDALAPARPRALWLDVYCPHLLPQAPTRWCSPGKILLENDVLVADDEGFLPLLRKDRFRKRKSNIPMASCSR